MKNKNLILFVNVCLIIVTIFLSLLNLFLMLQLKLTGSKYLNLTIFLMFAIFHLIAISVSIRSAIVSNLRSSNQIKELERVRLESENCVETKMYQSTICDAMKSILNSEMTHLVNLFEDSSVTLVEAHTSRSDAEESSQLFTGSSMIILNAYRTYPKLTIEYGDGKTSKDLSIVLDNSGVSNFENSSLCGVPTSLIIHVYQLISDLTRTDILIKDLVDGDIVIKCRPEESVYNDYKDHLTKNLIHGGNNEVKIKNCI